MEHKKKIKHIIILSAVFCILYLVLALRPTATELYFSPQWTVSIDSPVKNSPHEKSIPFKLGQKLGYFTEDGDILLCVTFPYKAVISEYGFSTFGTANRVSDFYSQKNELLFSADLQGFPYLSQDKAYVFLPGGTSFARCLPSGKEAWRYEYYAPVSAFASGDVSVCAGFADGKIMSFDDSGKITQDFFPGGSNYNVILGAGISHDGKTIACLSGHDRQRFIVSQEENNSSKIIFHKYIENETYNQVPVKFSADDSVVFYGFSEGLGLVNLRTHKSSEIKVKGRIIQIEESETTGFIFVLSRNGNTNTITVVEPFANRAAEFSFTAEHSFIHADGEDLYTGRDNKISKLTVSRK
ncbi:MAG: hypothetical protein J6Z17_00650 [Treponema sp.]|nr:hypothetical protein [Treponema sp.]